MKAEAQFLERLQQLLEAGEIEPSRVLDQLLKEEYPALRQMLRRCALMRSFDQDVFASVLSAGLGELPPPDFKEFVELPEVERVPRSGERYRIKDRPRQEYLTDWQKDRELAKGWHAKLADFCRLRHPEDSLDILYHLVGAHSEEAAAFLGEQFEKADQRFDLAQCFSLLQVALDQRLQADPIFLKTVDSWKRYYQARALFAEAYFQTTSHFPRRRLVELVDQILSPDIPQWILHLHATGGMGKTIFLRWVVARKLVPESIPCARLDLDDYNLEVVKLHPWLLLLPIARQLDEQLLGLFSNMLASYAPHLRYLDPPETRPLQAAPLELGPAEGKALLVRFSDVLREARLSRVVIVLDTLEEVTLYPEAFLETFHQLRALHDVLPSLRLVLSGRYRIPEKIPQLQQIFDQGAIEHEVARFDDMEAKELLRMRGVDEIPIIDAIIARLREPDTPAQPGGSNPFKLSLFAELALSHDQLTPEEVANFPDADFAYLLERVIKRIPSQSLRWVVRYGALPRRLTPLFIANVLLEPLQKALRGDLSPDNPQEHLPPRLERYAEQDVWVPDPQAEPTTEQLWNDLVRHCSDHGWISRKGEAGAEAVQFHGDVADPMRDILSRQQIFGDLQLRSVRYFEDLAAQEPQRWADWTCAAVFHRFQYEGQAAEAYWDSKLRSSEAQRDPAARRRIATEVLGREYADEGKTPRRLVGTDEVIISPLALAKAHVEALWAIVEIANSSPNKLGDVSIDLRRHMKFAEEIQVALGEPGLPTSLKVVVVALLHLAAQEHGEAIRLLDTARRETTDPNDRALVLAWLAETKREFAQPDALTFYEEVVRLFPKVTQPRGLTLLGLRRKLARLYAAEGRYHAAREQLREAEREGEEPPAALQQLRLDAVELAVDFRDVNDARATIESFESLGPRNPSQENRRSMLEGRLRRLQKDPERGLEPIEAVLTNQHTPGEKAWALYFRGTILGDLMHFSRALDDLRLAGQIVESAAPNLTERCTTRQALILGRDMGRYKAALLTLVGVGGKSFHTVEHQLELVFILFQKGSKEAADKMKALQEQMRQVHPSLRARVLAAGLALGLLPKSEESMSDLCSTLERIQPHSARLTPLGLFRYRERELETTRQQQKALLNLLSTPSSDSPSFAADSLNMVEILRVLGERKRARGILDPLLDVIRKKMNGYLFLRCMQAFRRLEPQSAWKQFPESPSGGTFQLEKHPYLYGVLLLEYATALLDADRNDAVPELLQEAEVSLSEEKLSTRWNARLEELRGRLAQRLERGEDARDCFLRAGERYGQLGDDASQYTMEKLATATKAPEPVVTVGGIRASSAESPIILKPAEPAHLSPDEWQVFEKLRPRPGKAVSELLPPWILENWQQTRRFLEKVLFPADIQRRLGHVTRPAGVHLEVSQAFLSALPWELAEFPGEREHGPGSARLVRYLARVPSGRKASSRRSIRWVQTTLQQLGFASLKSDGILGPRTQRAIRDFQLRNGLEITGAIDNELHNMLRSLVRRQSGAGIVRALVVAGRPGGYGESQAPSVAPTVSEGYRGVGLDSKLLVTPTLEEFAIAFRQFHPTVLHFIGAIQERRGTICLEFGRGYSKEAEPPDLTFTTTVLDQALARTNEGEAPFLILDIDRPESSWEAVFALALRNRFAADLLQLGSCTGILASGLAQPGEADWLQQAILSCLTNHAPVGELASSIRSLATRHRTADVAAEDPSGSLCYLGVALFTESAELPVSDPYSNPGDRVA